MTENRETTIIDVKLDAGKVAEDLGKIIEREKELRAEQSALNDEIKKGNDVNGENSKRLIEVKDQLSWVQKQAKALSATTKLLNADSETYADTLNGQRQKLADMQKAYAELSKTQRESDGGKQFLDAIHKQSEAVKELEAAMGDHRRNVGNYPKEITALVPALGNVTSKMDALQGAIESAGKVTPQAFSAMAGSIKSATVQALRFIATPIGALLAGLAAAVKVVSAAFGKLSEAFAKNDEAGTNLARLFASFQPILTWINKAFDGLATILGKVAGKLADIIAYFSDASAEAQQLVTDVDDLQEAERQYAVASAERNKEIARLRAEAASTTDLDARKKALSEAIKLEEQNLNDQLAIARQRLANLEATAKQEVDTSDATKDAIAQARAAMYQSEQNYYSGVRRLNSELRAIDAEQIKSRDARAKAITDLERKQAEDEMEIRRQAEDFALSLMEDGVEKEIAIRKTQGERELQALQERLDTDLTLTETARDELRQLIIGKEIALQTELQQMYNEQVQADAQRARDGAMFIAEQRLEAVEQMRDETDEEQRAYEGARWEAQKEVWRLQMEEELAQVDLTNEERAALQAKWDAVLEAAERSHQNTLVSIDKKANAERLKDQLKVAQASAQFMGELGNILAEYGEQNKAAAIASKALALGKIAVETGIAIASGTAQAQSVPFPANIAAIATTVTSVLASIGSAIATVKGAKFSHGGVVEGGSYSRGDVVPAMLSPQEVVLNPTQTAQTLFAIANGGAVGGNMKALAEVVVAAVAAQPAPVVDYREFTTFENDVVNYQEIASI